MDIDKQVKYAQMDLLIEIKRVCEINNIKFCLIAGSLLGAIRHDGFIPWDDDIDVGMLRCEYDKFLLACKKDLSQEYSITDVLEGNSPLVFAKIRIKNTQYREQITHGLDLDDGIFLDIFPFDNVPNNLIKRKFHSIQIYIIKKILLLRCGFNIKDSGKLKAGIYIILKQLSKIKTIDSWKKICLKLIIKYNQSPSNYVTAMGGSYSYIKEMKSKQMFTDLITHKFESIEISIPRQYHLFLKSLYGDYMKLPPKDKRAGKHKVEVINLGNYKIKYSDKLIV